MKGDFDGKTDDQLADELRELSYRIGKAISYREDLIEAMERRNMPALTLRGMQPVCDAVAARLGIEAPRVDELPRRDRDETFWWTNTSSIAAIVNLFRQDAMAAASDMEPADAERWRFYATSPQTALMLGSRLDPNDDSMDWKAECDRLADDIRSRE